MAENGFTGLEQMNDLMKHLSKMGKSIDENVKDKALQAGAEVVKDKIEKHPNLPVSDENGKHARDHLLIKKGDEGQFDIGFANDFFYLLFHEIGAMGGVHEDKNGRLYTTPSIPSKPFMRPAFENNKDEIEKAMMKVIKKELGI